MRNILPKSPGTLILALALAAAVWVIANAEQNPEVTGTFPTSLSVVLEGLPQNLDVYGARPDKVNVKIRAPQDSWSRLRSSAFRAHVDLSGLGPGTQDLEVKVECSDGRVRVLEKDPARVSVRLEPIRERSIPVRVRALDDAPVGFTMLTPRATPSQVTIRGAAPLADLVSEAYVELRLEGSKVTFAKTYRPVLRDVQGKEIAGVDLSPTSVQVEVPIEQLRNFKTVSIKAVITGTVSPGYWISGVVVQPSTVSFGGDPQILDRFAYVETTPVDVSAAVTEVLRTVTIDVPAGTALEKKPEVFVKVSVQPIPGSQIVRRPVTLANVGKGITATLLLSAVDIRLAGAVADLQRLRATDISASIEVTGLLTGTYTLPIQLSGVPTGTTVLEISPDRAGVSLR